jgi:MerR family transcriptional regulator, thiopeptide resistance regulator
MTTFERVIPLLVYRDIQAAHDFLVQAFGFESGGVERGADGQPVHGEVRVGETAIWLHRVAVDNQLDSPETREMAGAGLVVHVSDIDAHFARARAAGASIDCEPTERPYGLREYGARDPEGHHWWFAMPIAADASGHW